ncbi:hypothetical protein BsWGS_17338 [Bradybaena similaris]
MTLLAALCICSALVAVGKCQDMTSFMFQALGMDPPPMPPVMPQSLREHLYPGARERQLMLQKQFQLQKQRYINYLTAQKQKQMKPNPYNAAYSTNTRSQPRLQSQPQSRLQSQPQSRLQSQPQPLENSVFSPANMIRQPGAANSAAASKGNPYSVSYQDGGARKGSAGNPYSSSRASASSNPAVRNSALRTAFSSPAQAAKFYKTWQTMKVMRDQPRKMTDAKAAGCKLPVDSAAASVLMFNDCRNPGARMVCQSELMTCVNVGMAAMCCPYGMNRLAMDTMSYVNKLQQFMAELA